jgi:hypothetical protein
MAPSNALVGATSGAVGACVALTAVYPLVLAKVRLQAQRKRRAATGSAPIAGAIDVLARVVREEGAAKLYVGLGAALMKTASTNFIFYYFFTLLGRTLFKRAARARKSVSISLAHGISAGICVQLCVLPIDMVVTRLQTTKQRAESATGLRAFVDCVRSILNEGGIFNLWAGLAPGLALTVNPGVTTVMRDLLTAGRTLGRWGNFWTGMVSKATASTITYPYTVAKVQMMTQRGARKTVPSAEALLAASTRPGTGGDGGATAAGDGGAAFEAAGETARDDAGSESSLIGVLVRIVRSGGVGALYTGLGPQLAAAVTKEALLNMVRLEIAGTVRRMFALLARGGGGASA